MRVEKLVMKGFRGFEEVEIEFPKGNLAVFVGVNGAGKSSILDCLAVAISDFFAELTRGSGLKGVNRQWTHTDVPNSKGMVDVGILISDDGQDFKQGWKYAPDGKYLPAKESDILIVWGPRDWAEGMNKKLRDNPKENFPVAVYYAVDRNVSEIPLRIQKKRDYKQLAAYQGALSRGMRDFDQFFEWFRIEEDLENELIRDDSNHLNKTLQATRKAIETFLPGIKNIRVRRRPRVRLIVDKYHVNTNVKVGTMEVGQLSEGEKTLLAMIGDLARRLAIANPSLTDPLTGKGIVMIDEVDLHLHPGWQRQVIPRLLSTFPNIQFLITTHSPQVLSAVKGENIFLLKDFKVTKPDANTYGLDSNAILYYAFGVSEFPEDTERELEELFKLIDEEKFKEANRKLNELTEKYGYDFHELSRARNLIAIMQH